MNRGTSPVGQPSQQILQAAFACLAEKGYRSVSLREIAHKAGVALSQLHYYFHSKEGLLLAVVEETMRKHLAEIKKQLEQGVSSREKIWLVIQFFEEKMKQDPAWFKVLFDFVTLGIQEKAFRPHLQRLFKEASEILAGHIAHLSTLQGGAKQHSPTVLARILLASIYGILLQALIEPCDDAMLLEALDGLKTVFA